MSQMKKLSPVSISTQAVAPPYVPLVAKSSSRSMNASASSALAIDRPFAATSARATLARTASAFIATGSEPRVPQNRTSMKVSLLGSLAGVDDVADVKQLVVAA